MNSAHETSVWRRLYRFALLVLPPALRRKHGDAMVALFARELDGANGRWARLRIAVSAMNDVLRRAPYEWLYGEHDANTAHDSEGTLPPVRVRDVSAQLLVPFGVSFTVSTGLMIALYVQRSRFDVSPLEQFVLSLPYMCVLTVPLALCVSVAWMGLRTRRAVSSAYMPRGLQRSVLFVASGVAAFTLLLAAEIVPRANARLVDIRNGHVAARTDRAMTLSELHRAVRAKVAQSRASTTTDVNSTRSYRMQIAALEVEYHKKLVLAASCIVLALVGLALGWYMARVHAAVVVLSSIGVFVLFIVSIMAGESMADTLAVSPAFAMWAGTELMVYAVLFNAAAQRSATKRVG